MLKRAGIVTAAAAALTMMGSTAFATPMDDDSDLAPEHEGQITFNDAWNQFNAGGAAAGYGVSSLVSGAYAGIALTPSLVTQSVSP